MLSVQHCTLIKTRLDQRIEPSTKVHFSHSNYPFKLKIDSIHSSSPIFKKSIILGGGGGGGGWGELGTISLPSSLK